MSGTDFFGGGGAHPPEIICTPPEAFGTAPKSFCTPANYIYFDLIVSYLIILTTRFVKLPILWSQILPCRPRKQILLNFFLGLSGRPAKASSSTPLQNENMKIRLCLMSHPRKGMLKSFYLTAICHAMYARLFC